MRIVATHELPGPAWARLPDGVVVGRIEDAEILIGMNEPVPFDAMPSLRLVANFSVGYDAIDVAECRRRGIVLTNTPGVLDAAVADLTFALILAARRRLVEGDMLIRRGEWKAPEFLGREVSGTTLAIVGMGRIGSVVARRAAGFDMHVVEVTSRSGNLDDALRAADVVSVHTPLNDATRGLISRERLALLQDGATFVNTARGAVVDEDALVDELVSGRIGAGLDVFVHEPHVPERLYGLPNVVLAPHIASATVETREAMASLVVDNVLAFLAGRPLPTEVA
ncbi:MAG: D-glycerate dehydrogenase [Actinomycetota bacterium]